MGFSRHQSCPKSNTVMSLIWGTQKPVWLEQMEQGEKWEETNMRCGGVWGLQGREIPPVRWVPRRIRSRGETNRFWVTSTSCWAVRHSYLVGMAGGKKPDPGGFPQTHLQKAWSLDLKLAAWFPAAAGKPGAFLRLLTLTLLSPRGHSLNCSNVLQTAFPFGCAKGPFVWGAERSCDGASQGLPWSNSPGRNEWATRGLRCL